MSEKRESGIRIVEVECRATTGGQWGVILFLLVPIVIAMVYAMGTSPYRPGLDSGAAMIIFLLGIVQLASLPLMFFGRRYKGVISLPAEPDETLDQEEPTDRP